MGPVVPYRVKLNGLLPFLLTVTWVLSLRLLKGRRESPLHLLKWWAWKHMLLPLVVQVQFPLLRAWTTLTTTLTPLAVPGRAAVLCMFRFPVLA